MSPLALLKNDLHQKNYMFLISFCLNTAYVTLCKMKLIHRSFGNENYTVNLKHRLLLKDQNCISNKKELKLNIKSFSRKIKLRRYFHNKNENQHAENNDKNNENHK